MNSQVKQNLKGSRFIKTLPKFIGKVPKWAVDHEEPKFVTGRKQKLAVFVSRLVNLPHVVDMTCTKAFLGIIDQVCVFRESYPRFFHESRCLQVREVSFAFQDKLGLTLAINKRSDALSPAVIQSIQKPENCEGIFCGDCVSRVNGQSVAEISFSGDASTP